jgi:transcriptional regulator with XRE-family HTH domain
MTIGHAIKMCRIQRGWSQTALAESAGVSVSYLSLLERDRRDPVVSVLLRIINALGMPPVLFFYLATDDRSLKAFDPGLHEKLSYAAMQVFKEQPE